jgi:peptide/nickel transport system substrate-binding protein
MMPRSLLHGLAALWLIALAPAPATAGPELRETPYFAERVAKGELPAVAERVPKVPLVAELARWGREVGKSGGDIVTLAGRARDIRYVSAYSYARLVGYDQTINLGPDILERLDEEDERVFTLHLRPGHRWSDGNPFTAEDFRYWWEDIANNKMLSPSGPPDFMIVEGEAPRFELVDPQTVRFTWSKPNPRFLPTLAQPRDPFIYRPAHYLKQFHIRYANPEALQQQASKAKLKSWAALHNRMDEMFENTNPDLPTLQPWRVTNAAPASRFVFERNPFYHRIDAAGQQLPYVDRIIVDIASSGLMAAKGNAGEADFLARGLSMSDVPVLKEGEKAKGYHTLLWRVARGSEVALYPNLTTSDPVWRALNRDVRFRRALSLAIDRHTINNALLFGLGTEGNNTVRESSPLSRPDYRRRWAQYDPAMASRLLDEAGLAQRGSDGIRKLADGRPLEIVVEVDGEAGLAVDTLELIAEFWRDVGVKLFIKPQDRMILRNRAYSGSTVMVASYGLDNAIPIALMSPAELAPVHQDNMAWPKWGQFVETLGRNGEPCDTPGGRRLLALYNDWLSTADEDKKEQIWHEMLEMHADNQWVIGTVAGAIQPIVMRDGLKNLPTEGLYSWEPTALLGVYRIDEIFWDRADRRLAEAR